MCLRAFIIFVIIIFATFAVPYRVLWYKIIDMYNNMYIGSFSLISIPYSIPFTISSVGIHKKDQKGY